MDASISKENKLQLAVCGSTVPFQELLELQKGLLHHQIDQLQNIVVAQCKLTGVNPLSQEMAAGALSIKIGKRPRDLLNPKAVKYMQSVFSIKDAITKKESREISALFGVTVTQVREYFTTQRSRVRKFVRLSREKALRSSAPEEVQNGDPMSTDPAMTVYPVPLNSLGPASSEEAPCCSAQDETLTGLEDSDRHFLENIFNLMRKEETFSGQVKLMEWILQIQNSSVLYWFLTKGGVMILATWLSQAASEEQTSVLHVILKVLCHLPLHKTLPVHMSAILQSVNRLRFYRTSDISNRARILLSRWSKMFARSQAMKKPSSVKSSADAQDEMLLKQSISEIMGDESWEAKKIDLPEDTPAPSFEGSENFRKLEPLQPPKLLPAFADDSSKKLIRGVSSSQTRERRKVLLVEQPGQKPAGRSLQVARSATTSQGRPLSADDIQKAKLRAQFMQSKYGKSGASPGGGHQVRVEGLTKISSSQGRTLLSASKAHVQPQVEEHKDSVMLPSEVSSHQEAPSGNKINLNPDEPIWKKCKRVQIPWWTPAEMRIQDVWRVGTGENSKEVEVQRNRIRREKETIYRTAQEIPSDPKEPWDREMEYDDTLTPEVPTEQLPDADGVEAAVSPREETKTSRQNEMAAPAVPSQSSDGGMPEPDLELLAVLLKNPELVFALTSGRSGNLSSEETVKLLDMIKANGVGSLEGLAGLGRKAEENVQVSLPSPTPPSDPVTRGWRPEVSKNPFSRQGEIANRERIASSEIPATKLVRPEPHPINMTAQQAASVPNLSHQTILHYSLLQTATVSLEKLPLPPMPAPVVVPYQHQNPATISANLQLPPSEIAQSIKSIPLNGGSPLTPNLAAAALPSTQVQTSITRNTPERPPLVAFPASPSLPTPPPPLQRAQPHPHPHPTLIPESLPSRSLRVNHGLTSKPHAETNQNNYNPFVGGVVRPGIIRDRNELLGEPEFESWSPENSPVRPTEYVSGWSSSEPRMNMGNRNSYRSEPDRWNSSGYRDYNRHGNRRRREWRR